jgi:uncharacterized membrane protein
VILWHPMIVHFPLALALTATLALIAARLIADDRLAARLASLGTWNLCAAAVGALAALGSGLGAALGLQLSLAARQAVSLHVKWAVCAAFGLLLLAVWRGAGNDQDARPSAVLLVILFLAAAALVATAYRGGLNVYLDGIGVAR